MHESGPKFIRVFAKSSIRVQGNARATLRYYLNLILGRAPTPFIWSDKPIRVVEVNVEKCCNGQILRIDRLEIGRRGYHLYGFLALNENYIDLPTWRVKGNAKQSFSPRVTFIAKDSNRKRYEQVSGYIQGASQRYHFVSCFRPQLDSANRIHLHLIRFEWRYTNVIAGYSSDQLHFVIEVNPSDLLPEV